MKRLFVVILACMLLTVPAFARALITSFYCDINVEKMPKETVYIDMLIPLSEKDAEFSAFNDDNGEKYGISKESEISTYNQDGFSSYTFHKEGAKAEIKPFLPSEEVEIFCVKFLADEEGRDDEGFPRLEQFGEKYQKAKFVYIDSNGNILGVTNEIDIRKLAGNATKIDITLSGAEATCEVEDDVVLALLILGVGIFVIVLRCIFKILTFLVPIPMF